MKRIFIVVALCLLVCVLAGVSHAATDSVNLSWGASPSDDVAGYNIYYGTAPDAFGAPIAVGNVTAYELAIEDIPDGADTTYYFGVSAVDTSGNESSITSVTPDGVATTKRWDFLAPSPPPSLSAE